MRSSELMLMAPFFAFAVGCGGNSAAPGSAGGATCASPLLDLPSW